MKLTLSTAKDCGSLAANRVLGDSCLGHHRAAIAVAWPRQLISAPLLGAANDCVHEIWQSADDCCTGEREGISYRRSAGLLFGVITLDEADFAAAAAPLQAATEEAYRRIFRLMAHEGLAHLWRVWNYLADINGEYAGLERYRHFNIGRQEAFLAGRRGASGNVPAACAIGLAAGPLSIAFMAGDQAALPIENPRQVSAYHYPAAYGPRSPTFSRAALAYLPGQEILFVSGTASILGHQTVHPDDAASQCVESLANVAAVLEAANRLSRARPYALESLAYRVYVRRAADFAAIRQVLLERLGDAADLLYLQADICRADLLVEIEAMASQSLDNC